MRAQLVVGHNDLGTLYPALSKEWHPSFNASSPQDYLAGSNKKVWWQCENGHEWEAIIQSRVRGRQCAVCTGKRILSGYNDLATVNPSLAAEWHPTKNELVVSEVSPSSGVKAWWQCSQGHEWKTSVNNRSSNQSGCPVCRGKKPEEGLNDAASLCPQLVTWYGAENAQQLSAFTVGSPQIVQWRCPEGHCWNAEVRAMTAKSIPTCPQCIQYSRSLATVYPHALTLWDHTKNEISPYQVSYGSDAMAWWLCSEGHSWQEAVSQGGQHQQCPMCSGKRFVSGISDFATMRAEEAQMFHRTKNTLSPEEFHYRSGEYFWWQCSEGHEWKQPANAGRKIYCRTCAGQLIIYGVNDISVTHPSIAAQWDESVNGPMELNPVSFGSNMRVGWVCNKKHQWCAAVCDRTGKSSGCPECFNGGTSRAEQQITEFIRNLLGNDADVIIHNRALCSSGREVDVYVPSLHFALEFNGTYWHTESKGKDRQYHATKRQEVTSQGITLLQVWEDEWNNSPSTVLLGIAYRLGRLQQARPLITGVPDFCFTKVSARKTKTGIITYEQASTFLNMYHIQGAAAGSMYVGLRDAENNLRAVLVVKRTGKAGLYAIERYATAGVIPGGFTKALKFAQENLGDVTTWVTFADLQVSNGDLYRNTGFSVDKILAPDYSYVVRGKRVHKFNYRLARFKTDPNLAYVEGMSETQLARLNGLERVWDSGKIRFIKHVS